MAYREPALLSDGRHASGYCAQAHRLEQEREVSPDQWLSEEVNGKTRSWQNHFRVFSVLFLSSFQKLRANERYIRGWEQVRKELNKPQWYWTLRLLATYLLAMTAVSQMAQSSAMQNIAHSIGFLPEVQEGRWEGVSYGTPIPGIPSCLAVLVPSRDPSQHQRRAYL